MNPVPHPGDPARDSVDVSPALRLKSRTEIEQEVKRRVDEERQRLERARGGRR